MENKVLVNKSDLTAVGDAVRSQTGESNLLTLGEMESRIRTLSSGGGSGLPTVSTEDNYKILQVIDGEWQKVEPLCYSETSTEVDLLAEADYPFSYNTMFGANMYVNTPSPIALVEGQTYKVVWDGELYLRTAQTFNVGGINYIAVGNIDALTGVGHTEDPFAIGHAVDGSAIMIVDIFGDYDSCKIRLYEGESETIKTIDPKYLPKDDILTMIDAYMKEALGGVY